MTGSGTSRTRRIVAGIVGALVILAVGIYGPATLVGPLPAAVAVPLVENLPPVAATPPALPEDGSSALALSADSVIASTSVDPVPMGGTAKIVTILVVLDKHPLLDAGPGANVPITAEDYADYLRYAGESARTVSLIEGEIWTQREMLQAIILGSSNNHADALARWAFGSMDAYLEAASGWLEEHGLTGTSVVDATGLDEDSISSGADAARLAALAFAQPVVAEIAAQGSAIVADRRVVNNQVSYRTNDGVTTLSRSFTDQAGLCVLFAVDVPVGGEPIPLYGAFLREPDYPTLDADITAVLATAGSALAETTVISQGTAYARFVTAWGDTADAVAASSESRLLCSTEDLTYTIRTDPLTVVAQGAAVGEVTVSVPGDQATAILRLDGRINDPGPLWRITHPVPVIEALFQSFSSR